MQNIDLNKNFKEFEYTITRADKNRYVTVTKRTEPADQKLIPFGNRFRCSTEFHTAPFKSIREK